MLRYKYATLVFLLKYIYFTECQGVFKKMPLTNTCFCKVKLIEIFSWEDRFLTLIQGMGYIYEN